MNNTQGSNSNGTQENNNAQEKLQTAMQFAMAHRPQVGGFPFLAECLRQAGVEKNIWTLPSAQSMYVFKNAELVHQGTPLVSGMAEVPNFNEEALIKALRTDQAGQSTFPEFLNATWKAGVVGYEVNFLERTVAYYGAHGEKYTEAYPEVVVSGLTF
ncbi:MAG: DUF1398 family protein [Candidatus Pacebacteria bacterium]|nr:DUF1398 family protein [Candidatus Paceibacterota bacterium]